MSKRYVLVHDCGYVVNPGDKLVCTDPGAILHGGEVYEFVGIDIYKCEESNLPTLIFLAEVGGNAFFASRFNCTIQEIDDE